jgi:hypothetical protein
MNQRLIPHRFQRVVRRHAGALALAAAVVAQPLLLPSAAVRAQATIQVTTTVDLINAGDGVVSLREAILDAASGDTISLPAGTYALTDTVSAGGADDGTGGDLDVFGKSITIVGAGADTTVIDQQVVNQRVLQVLSTATLSLSGVTITGGDANTGTGGGLQNSGALTVTQSTITGNTNIGNAGGGIANSAGATLSVISSTVSNNSTTAGGQAGGGIFNAGTLTVRASSILTNTAATGGAGGGGIASTGGLTVVNSTFSGNSVAGSGGAINSSGAGSVVINSTLSGNTADSDSNGGGGGGLTSSGGLTISNSIVAENTDVSGGNTDVSNTVATGGGNLVGDNSGVAGQFPAGTPNANGDYVGSGASPLDPQLGPLADNGGPTLTHALLSGSLALDNAVTAACAAAPVNGVDQRGRTRQAACDIGAFEAVAELNVAQGTTQLADGVSTVDFDETTPGTPVSRSFTISNTGETTLTLTAPITVPNGYTATSPALSELGPNQSTSFSIELTAAASGTFNGNVTIGSDAGEFSFAVTGVVAAASPVGPEIVVSDGATPLVSGVSSVNFGVTGVGAPINKTFVVSNTGASDLTLGALAVPAGYTVVVTPSASVGPGLATLFTVRLTAAAAGVYSGTVSLANDDSNESPFTFNVTGTVSSGQITPAEIAVSVNGTGLESGGSVNFGSVAKNSQIIRTFTISNTGGTTLQLGPAISVPRGFSIVNTFGTTTLAPGASTTFVLQLTGAASGTFAGTVVFANSDSDENPFTFFVSGNVIGERLLFLPLIANAETPPAR